MSVGDGWEQRLCSLQTGRLDNTQCGAGVPARGPLLDDGQGRPFYIAPRIGKPVPRLDRPNVHSSRVRRPLTLLNSEFSLLYSVFFPFSQSPRGA